MQTSAHPGIGNVARWFRGIVTLFARAARGLRRTLLHHEYEALAVRGPLVAQGMAGTVAAKMAVEVAVEVAGKKAGIVAGMVLKLMAEKPEISIPEIAVTLGVSKRSIERTVRELKIDGKVTRIGPDRGGTWDVKEA